MIQTYRKRLQLLLVGALVWGVASLAAAQEQAPEKGQPDARLTATATSVAVGVGWTWGKGTLTLLDGSQHNFKIDGLNVIAVGVKQATVVGNVFNLKKLEDFEGVYASAGAGATIGGGGQAVSMRNDKGVVINVGGTSVGVDLRLAVSGMNVKLIQ